MDRFIIDAMLGRLALWLRLAGVDTIYETDLEDDRIIKIAASENRTILTSDANLNQRAMKEGVQSMLVRGAVDYRIAKIFHEFNISPEVDPDEARCSKCNGELVKISTDEKSKIREFVHKQTYDHYDVFWYCPDCDAVYFQGGYWDNIQKYMEHISRLMEAMD
ncbi:hypothetical protein EU537_02035 [Candidatus Thorarchaeota archaeon]|nr:MAG: hypothetical protein EU537_02035 [Candidatus Thorarchaeota archaeon]